MKIIIEKGDSKEQMMMAEAMLANKMVSSIERADYEINVVHKRDDEMVDFCGWDDDVAEFCRRMNLIIKGVVLEYGCNYQAIQKPLAANSILRKDFKAWQRYRAPKGDRVFPRQMFIAEKLLKLLSINA